MTDETEKYKAPALDKGLDILEALSLADFGLTQAELARQLKRSVGEIFRMLMVLRKRNLIQLDELSDRYFLTTKLFELAHRTPIIKRLTVSATPIMHHLTKLTHQSVHMAVEAGEHALIVGQVDNPGDNVFSIKIGSRMDIWRTSSGRVILAFLSDLELQIFVDETAHQGVKYLADIKTDFSRIVELGYEIKPSYVVKGITNISAPIFDHEGRAVAAMTIPFIERYDEQLSMDDCIQALVKATQKLTQHIGGLQN